MRARKQDPPRSPREGQLTARTRGGFDARVARLALSPDEAAAALGCSRTFFDEHVAPELRTVYRGRRRFVAVAELERWLEREAVRPSPANGR